jgi:hypothetical protein
VVEIGSGTDENRGDVNRASNDSDAGVRVSDTVENGAGIATKECVVGAWADRSSWASQRS